MAHRGTKDRKRERTEVGKIRKRNLLNDHYKGSRQTFLLEKS